MHNYSIHDFSQLMYTKVDIIGWTRTQDTIFMHKCCRLQLRHTAILIVSACMLVPNHL